MKRQTKKNRLKIFAMTTLLFISMLVPAQAASVRINVNPQVKGTMSLTDLQEKLLENNTSLKSLELQLDILNYNFHTTQDNLDDLDDDMDDMRDQISASNAVLTTATTEKNRLQLLLLAEEAEDHQDPVKIAELKDLIAAEDAKITKANQSIVSLTNARNSLSDAEDGYELTIDTLRNKREESEEQKAMTIENLKYSIEKLYYSILGLDLETQKTQSKVSLAQMALDSEKLRVDLGLSVDSAVQTAQQNLNTAKNGLNSLKNQRDQVMNTLKVLIGYPIDEPLALRELPMKQKTLPTYSSGLNNAVNNGKEVKYKKMIIKNQEYYIELIEDEYDLSDEKIREAEFTLDGFEIDLEVAKSQVASAYFNSYNEVKLLRESLITSENQLKLAKTKNDQAHLQYDLGLLSKAALDSADAEYLQAELAFKQEQYDYSIAVATYNMVAQGYLVN